MTHHLNTPILHESIHIHFHIPIWISNWWSQCYWQGVHSHFVFLRRGCTVASVATDQPVLLVADRAKLCLLARPATNISWTHIYIELTILPSVISRWINPMTHFRHFQTPPCWLIRVHTPTELTELQSRYVTELPIFRALTSIILFITTLNRIFCEIRSMKPAWLTWRTLVQTNFFNGGRLTSYHSSFHWCVTVTWQQQHRYAMTGHSIKYGLYASYTNQLLFISSHGILW